MSPRGGGGDPPPPLLTLAESVKTHFTDTKVQQVVLGSHNLKIRVHCEQTEQLPWGGCRRGR